ncbi:hypothetical protein AB4516_20190 [Vibrio sp. 10N.222.54.F12]|uniref:hypothetical protein n=1 Tax=Vibrio TaxID=662 RepID=UPI000C83E722|nr:hypothetical protein [Vibrio tasmaniensis]PMI24279.1 hypothetical protein BCU63_03600 [Vibrio splendidus]PML11187.1 hypothetical protein BCT83_21995 [Vibrio tasmaniensis]PML42693.1 hypothetical protein BCT76_21975 [Vibrio tasmaniensis]
MHNAFEDLLPINDWSIEGRKQYIEQNRLCIELVLYEALEFFDERKVSLTFGSQDNAKDRIISMFLSDRFNDEKLPNGIPRNIKLFSQIDYWCKFKSGKTFFGVQQLIDEDVELASDLPVLSTLEADLDKLSLCLAIYSELVAANMIYFWLQANRKLLDELGRVGPQFEHENADRVEETPTKYKVDSSFRYLCVFLDIESQIPDFQLYKNKYLTKGENKPQYTAKKNEKESHLTTSEVRLVVTKIIDYFYRVHREEPSPLCQVLLKSVGGKSLLDQYKIKSKDYPNFDDLRDKLTALKSPLKEGNHIWR